MVSSLAPKRLLGLTGGVFNFFGNLPSILVPIVRRQPDSGRQLQARAGLFRRVALMGALSYIFLVGRMERIE